MKKAISTNSIHTVTVIGKTTHPEGCAIIQQETVLISVSICQKQYKEIHLCILQLVL